MEKKYDLFGLEGEIPMMVSVEGVDIGYVSDETSLDVEFIINEVMNEHLKSIICLRNGWAEATCAEQGASADRKQAICSLSYKGILPGACKEKRKNSSSVCGMSFLMHAVFSLKKKKKKKSCIVAPQEPFTP